MVNVSQIKSMCKRAIIFIGPPASGKYTLANKLSNIIDAEFLHEHQILELTYEFFRDDKIKNLKLYFHLRGHFINFIVKNSEKKNLIITYAYIFNSKPHGIFFNNLLYFLKKSKYVIHIIELKSSLESRIKRNKNKNRLKIKPSKSNIAKSNARIRKLYKIAKMNSDNKLIFGINPLIINTDENSKKDCLSQIVEFVDKSVKFIPITNK